MFALPADLTPPVAVALARAVERIPGPTALPGGCLYEPKWDGYRCTTVHDGDTATLWSRRGTNLTPLFPEIATAAAAQLAPGTVLDGELVAWSDGRLDFGALQARMGRGPRSSAALARQQPASLALFDVLAMNGRDLRPLALAGRRRALEEAAVAWRPPLNLSPATYDVDEATQWFEAYAVAGIEGLVVKGAAQPYPAGERAWLKVKHRHTLDVVCAAVIGPRSAPQQVVAGLPLDGELRIVGRTGPLSPGARRALVPWLAPPAGPHPWPQTVSPGAFGRFNTNRTDPVELTLVEPLVVEVSADVAWSGTSFRHALRLIRVRPELHPMEISAP